MTVSSFLDRVQQNVTSTGTGTLSLGSAFAVNVNTLAGAGAVDGTQYSYVLTEGNNVEWGRGVSGSSGTTLTRNVVGSIISGTFGTSPINLLGAGPVVTIDVLAEDLAAFLVGSKNLSDVGNPLTALGNINGVSYGGSQSLTTAQKKQAQQNGGLPALMQSYLAGLTLSTAGSSSAFSVAAGVAADSTNVDMLLLASAISKTTASWAMGSGNGALDTGTIAINASYHVFLIERTDTDVVDVLVSTSATPALPASYTLSRRIGSLRTDGSAHWVAFTQIGDEFWLTTPVQDINSGAFGTSDLIVGLGSVPSGVRVKAIINVNIFGTAAVQMYLRPNFIGSQAPSFPNAPGFTLNDNSSGNGSGIKLEIWTDTLQSFTARASAAGTTMRINTLGWIDRRGRDN